MANEPLAVEIASRLRRSILVGRLKPGDSVKERDNAAELGVSRTPMREAIRVLAKEGLIELRPSRSPIVANPSLREVIDDIDVIRALEVLSGELACRNASVEEIEAIAELQHRLDGAPPDADPLDLFEIDMEIHRAIARASHNPSLAETHGAYLARLWRVRYLSARQVGGKDRTYRQHREIIAGLRARDAAEVARVVASHIDHIILNVRGYFDSSPRCDGDRPAVRG